MYLHELYEELGFNKVNYAKWAKNVLKDFAKDEDYTEEKNVHSKMLYKMKRISAILILDKYDYDHEALRLIACGSNDPTLRALGIGANFPDYYWYFIDEIRSIWKNARKIPNGFAMPSETGIQYKMLEALELIDEDKFITEKGKKFLLPRAIHTARGTKYHVIIKEALIDKLLLDYTEFKALPAPEPAPEPAPKVVQTVIINNITRNDVIYDL